MVIMDDNRKSWIEEVLGGFRVLVIMGFCLPLVALVMLVLGFYLGRQ